MESKKFNFKQMLNKKTLTIATIVLVGLFVAFFASKSIIESNIESKIVGSWERETMYLEHYNCYADMTTTFFPDGTYKSILTNSKTDKLLNTTTGKWHAYWFEAIAQSDDQAWSNKTDGTHFKVQSETKITNGSNSYSKIK